MKITVLKEEHGLKQYIFQFLSSIVFKCALLRLLLELKPPLRSV